MPRFLARSARLELTKLGHSGTGSGTLSSGFLGNRIFMVISAPSGHSQTRYLILLSLIFGRLLSVWESEFPVVVVAGLVEGFEIGVPGVFWGSSVRAYGVEE